MRLPPPSAAFGKAAQHGVAVLASCLVLLSPPTPHLAPCASAAPPTEEAQVNLKKGFNAAQLGLTSADALLSANQKRFKPLKAKLSKVLESNPLDFENPPTEQEKDKPHPMCWVPEHNPKEPDEANPRVLLTVYADPVRATAPELVTPASG